MPRIPDHSTKANWQPIRDAYLQRTPIPTFTELAEEFGLSAAIVARVANDEQWALARQKAQERALQSVKAGEVIMEAISADKEAVEQLRRAAVSVLLSVEQAGQHLVKLLADPANLRKGLDMANTASFTLSNTANALKTVGVIGIPKELLNAGKSGNGQWDKGLLQQINVTIGGLTGQAQVTAQDTTQSRSVATASEQAVKGGGVPTALPMDQPAIEVPTQPAQDAEPAQPDSDDDGANSSG